MALPLAPNVKNCDIAQYAIPSYMAPPLDASALVMWAGLMNGSRIAA